MNIKNEIIRLANELENEENAAFDLWTWLPSYKAARANHGDHSSQYRPNVSDILKEASMFISFLYGYSKDKEQEAGWFECPCGECESPGTCKYCDLYADNMMRCRAVEGAPHCPEDKPHEKCPFIRGNNGYVQKP